MKILYVEASVGNVVGGSLTGMVHLIRGLDRTRYQPVVVLYEEKSVADEFRAAGIPVHVFKSNFGSSRSSGVGQPVVQRTQGTPKLRRLVKAGSRMRGFVFQTLPDAYRMAALLRREAPDLIHASNGMRRNLDVIVAARMVGIPCISHVKAFDRVSYFERKFSTHIAASICMTDAIRKHCEESGLHPPRTHVIFDGLDLAAFRPTRSRDEVRRELGVPPDALLVGTIGHIQEWKGQLVLLKAIDRLTRTHPKSMAIFVGGVHKNGVEYELKCRRFVADAGLESRVIFTGPRDDVPDLIQALDVFAHTSTMEPFGRVIIEAMSIGKPVIATRAGGVPELIEHDRNGLLVEPGNSKDLADELAGLFDDPERARRLAARAAKDAMRFDLAHHVENVTRVYEEILGPPSPLASGGSSAPNSLTPVSPSQV